MHDESKWVRNAQKGDESAFAFLYREYRERVFRYFFSRVGNRSAAEELTSQTFLAVLEGLPVYRHRQKFGAWVFSIARNKAMDYFRRQKRLSGSEDEHYISLSVDPQILENIISAERVQALAQLIRQLPLDRQELLRLRFVVDLTYREIAEITGRRTAAVKKSIYRLLDEMKQSLEKDYE